MSKNWRVAVQICQWKSLHAQEKDVSLKRKANPHFKNISLVSSKGILLPKLFKPTVRKNCCSDQEKLLKFKAEGREFAKFLRSLEQFLKQ